MQKNDNQSKYIIEFVDVSKSFNKTPVLKNFSFHVEESKTLALLGLSGCGKTTALKLVCGLLWPDNGKIFVQGEKLTKRNLKWVRRNIGYVIQDGGLFPHLTAYENIQLIGKELNWTENKIRNRILELLELTQLTLNTLMRYPRELSGGQKQRVSIMRAMFLDPKILLLDEPMGALDPITRSELQDEFKALFKKLEKSVLLVTHDLFEAAHLADQIILLDQGQIVQKGTFQNLLKAPATEFVRKFVNSQRLIDGAHL